MERIFRVIAVALTCLLAACLLTLAALKGIDGVRNRDNPTLETKEPQETGEDARQTGISEDSDTDPPETAPKKLTPLVMTNTYDAGQIFIYDVSRKGFIYQKDCDKPIVPASITKLAVGLFCLNAVPADTVITVGTETKSVEDGGFVAKGSSTAYVKEGHQLTVAMLVEGMMLPSGNDAAYALAVNVGRLVSPNGEGLTDAEAVDYFMERVNSYLMTIGCTGTHFTVPDGNTEEDHYTTAEDLCVISECVMKNELMMKYAATVSEKVTYASGHIMTWKNTNALLNPESSYYCDLVTGLKTGSLDGRYSLIATVKVDTGDYIIGVFDTPVKEGRFLCARDAAEKLKKYTP